MSVEAILTVVAVALAVMALIPQERAQDLQVRLGGLTSITAIVASLLVLYWAFLEQVHALPGIARLARPLRWHGNWDPASASLLVLLVVAGLGYWSYRRSLPVYRLSRLIRAIADALARRRYGECIHLLEMHLKTIEKAHRGDYWQARLRLRVAMTPGEMLIRAITASRRPTRSEADAVLTPEETSIDPVPRAVAFRLPLFPEQRPLEKRYAAWAERPREAAQDLVRLISLTPALAAEIASVNPYLGLGILRIGSTWLNREFATDFARALLLDPDSVFYRELRRSENVDSNNCPVLDSREQPMLAALSADALRPEGPGLLYTFLYTGIDVLRPERLGVLPELLNGPIGDFHERGRWTSPPFATIYLLEIVGPRASVDPRAQLLNLYVAQTLVSELLRQLAPAEGVNLSSEWPTPTHYLLYATVSALRDLVRILQVRPESLEAVRAAQARPVEPATLPDHAIDVLGGVMYECMRSDKLDGRFKGYLLEVWWVAYSDKYKGGWAGSERVLAALVRGGHGGGDMRHRDGVAEALSRVDWVLQNTDAAEALRASFSIGNG